MPPNLTDREIHTIREGVRSKYARVASQAAAAGCFRYPTGREGMRLQGYPMELVQDFPGEMLQTFCGVGNPFTLGPIQPGEAVLDIGCGAGVDTLVAARLVGPAGRVAGVDATYEMIARARANLGQAGFANVDFEVAYAESLPFPDRKFDVVISNGVLNLTINKEQALKEAHRVLKRGGRLMVADMVLVTELPDQEGGRVENWFQ